jgi:multiple antibiotic resistance protein
VFATFLEAFIPLFVTIDPLGLVPLFLSMTERMRPEVRRRTSFEAVLWALIIALVWMFTGHAIFRFLAIGEADFRIAGGLILLVLAILDLLMVGKPAVDEHQVVGVVPLAMPLIAGPATLTNILVLAGSVGHAITALAVVANLAILLVVLLAADRIAKFVGLNTLRAFSKLVMVLLAAIAVNLIRTGIQSYASK